jgi:hypothetical protein
MEREACKSHSWAGERAVADIGTGDDNDDAKWEVR